MSFSWEILSTVESPSILATKYEGIGSTVGNVHFTLPVPAPKERDLLHVRDNLVLFIIRECMLPCLRERLGS